MGLFILTHSGYSVTELLSRSCYNNYLARMRVNLEDYYILQKLFLGDNLIIIFQYSIDIHERRVLELKEIVGFIDQSTNEEIKTVRIDDGEGGSYPFDL